MTTWWRQYFANCGSKQKVTTDEAEALGSLPSARQAVSHAMASGMPSKINTEGWTLVCQPAPNGVVVAICAPEDGPLAGGVGAVIGLGKGHASRMTWRATRRVMEGAGCVMHPDLPTDPPARDRWALVIVTPPAFREPSAGPWLLGAATLTAGGWHSLDEAPDVEALAVVDVALLTETGAPA